jgi:hypothetical protein
MSDEDCYRDGDDYRRGGCQRGSESNPSRNPLPSPLCVNRWKEGNGLVVLKFLEQRLETLNFRIRLAGSVPQVVADGLVKRVVLLPAGIHD